MTNFRLFFKFNIILFLVIGATGLQELSAQRFTDMGTNIPNLILSDIDWGDYNNDGNLDVLIMGFDATGKNSLVFNNNLSSSTFTNASAQIIDVGAGSASWGDYDNDGDLDLAITGENEAFQVTGKIYRNDGGDGFREVNTQIIKVRYGDIKWCDFDRDGDLDLLVTGETSSLRGTAKIYRNDGNDTFTDTFAELPGVKSSAVSIADYNNDGYPDILLTGLTQDSSITKIYRNTNPGWVEVNADFKGVQDGAAAWGDYDNDGDQDFFVSGYIDDTTNYSMLYRNNGGSFSGYSINIPGLKKGSAEWGDFDNDGDLDLLATGQVNDNAYYAAILENISFTFFPILGDLEQVKNSDAKWGDYDNDGDLDIILSGQNINNTYLTTIYRNNTTNNDALPGVPMNLNSSVYADGVLLEWDANPNTSLPGAASYNVWVGSEKDLANVLSPMADLTSGQRRIVQPGNAIRQRFLPLDGLKPGKYYWSAQSLDNSYEASAFATVDSFLIIGITTTKNNYNQPLCSGQEIEVPFTVTEDLNQDNFFSVELSNTKGVFDDPMTIGTLDGTTDGVVTAVIPAGITTSKTYKIRVVSSSPYVEGTDNGFFLTVFDQQIAEAMSPADGAKNVPANLRCSWIGVEYAEDYQVQFSDSQVFTNIIEEATVDGDEHIYMAEKLDSGKTYFWRVRPMYHCGPGQWSDINRFTTLSLITGGIASPIDPGQKLNLQYRTNNNFNADNEFVVQLSDKYGSFDDPVEIGRKAAVSTGTIQMTVPENAEYGAAYRIRIVGTSPEVIGSDNGNDLIIEGQFAYEINIMSPGEVFCAGDAVEVQYTLSNQFDVGNQFRLELSNPNGFFNNPTVIGTLDSRISGAISGVIPANAAGTAYRVRIVSTEPEIQSEDNGHDIIIHALPSVVISGEMRVLINETKSYTVPVAAGVTNLWTVTNGDILGADDDVTVRVRWKTQNPGIIKITRTVTETGCIAENEVNVIIYRNYIVSGVVRDAVTMNGLGNVKVSFSADGVEESAFTDGSGEYSLELGNDQAYLATAYMPEDESYIKQFYMGTNNILENTPVSFNANLSDVNFYLDKAPSNNNSISGRVELNSDPIDAKVILFLTIPDNEDEGNKYESRTYESVGEEGAFSFGNLHAGSYVALAVPYDQSVLPGYYLTGGSAVRHWLDATALHITSSQNLSNNVIKLVNMESISGIATISGTVYTETQEVGKDGDSPLAKKSVSGAMTFTVDENEKVRKYDFSKSEGGYIMPGIPEGSYTLAADKVGYLFYEYDFVVGDGTTVVDQDIILDSKDTVSVKEFYADDLSAIVYPNPAPGSDFNINFEAASPLTSVDMYDVLGNRVFGGKYDTAIGQNDIKIRNANLNSGMYYITLRTGDYLYKLYVSIVR